MIWHGITDYDFLTRDLQPTHQARDLWVCDEYSEFISDVCNRKWAFMEWHINKCTHVTKVLQNYLHPTSYYIQQCGINYYFKGTSITVNPLLRSLCCFQIWNLEKINKSVAEYWDGGTQCALRISDKVDQCYTSSIIKYPYYDYFRLSQQEIQD